MVLESTPLDLLNARKRMQMKSSKIREELVLSSLGNELKNKRGI